jgi:antirestriction protein ArdC
MIKAHGTASRSDLHAQITDAILSTIQEDSGQWRLPWRRDDGSMGLPQNALTNKEYNGINIVSLWVQAQKRRFSTALWASYKQWQELGAHVRRGEKASQVVFYKTIEVETSVGDSGDDGKRLIAKSYSVFNASQVDGYILPTAPDPLPAIERLAAVDRFIDATQARITEGGDRAYYNRASDHITMPDEYRFTGTATIDRREAYYSVKLHELSHWTGHETRLNRVFGKRFGDQAYAAEELVAELATAFLCAELRITQTTPPDHAQYLANWLILLKSDNRAIFSAAAKASEAARYLRELQVPEPSRPTLHGTR